MVFTYLALGEEEEGEKYGRNKRGKRNKLD